MGLLRKLGRRLRIAWHAPAHWQFRPGTIDRRIFRNVVVEDEYRLPSRFGPDDVILDVGAHIGTFAYAVLTRGAASVHCYEPDAENHGVLTYNLAPYRERVWLRQCAVWRSDVEVDSLCLHNPHEAANTGGIQVAAQPTSQAVAVVAFDDLVEAAAGPRGRIRLLKLDCEGAEWPILFTARTLDRVDAICGEYHLGSYFGPFTVAGFPTVGPEILSRFLREQGFNVAIEPNSRSPDPIGSFFAFRTRLSSNL
jgi:FkbM family methyltransferase